MWKQRYRNEALYPYNGPATIKPRFVPGGKKVMKRRSVPMKLNPVEK